jgi:hypothetical protein
MQGWVGTLGYRHGSVEIAMIASISCVILSEELALF